VRVSALRAVSGDPGDGGAAVPPFGRRPVAGPPRRPAGPMIDRPLGGLRAAFADISLGAVLFALPASTTAGIALGLVELVDGLEKPTVVAAPQDGSRRLLVAERSSRIRIVEGGTLTLPVLRYPHADGNCAVMGGYRYRGAAQPLLAGSYLYADWCTGRIWRATPGCGGWHPQLLLDVPFQISAFGEDENEEPTVLEWTTTGARLFDVVATPAASLFTDGFESRDASA